MAGLATHADLEIELPLMRQDGLHAGWFAHHAQGRLAAGFRQVPDQPLGALAAHFFVIADEQMQRPNGLAGEEIGRMKSWGTHPLSKAEHLMSSPTLMNDLPQTFMEPLLFKTACMRGTQARMSTEYLRHVQDAEGVTTTCRDRLSGKEVTIRSRYLVGADGGNSLVAANEHLPFEGDMGVDGSMNIWFRADLSKYVAHRPSVLYWVMQPGADVGGIGMGLVRMVRPWNEWLIVWGYDIHKPAPKVDEAMATQIARQLVGDPNLKNSVAAGVCDKCAQENVT
jgi:2,4-dichlorophenol 6-monooxygenase